MNYSKNDYYADQQAANYYDRNDPESYKQGQDAKLRLSNYGSRYQNKNKSSMGYNQNYQPNSLSYNNNRSYQSQGPRRDNQYNGNNNWSNNRQGNNQQQKKHSGAVAGQDKNGNPYVRGWKYDKTNGMRSFFAAPYKGTKNVTSKSGKEWENWMVKVSPQGAQSFIVSGLYDVATKRVIINDLGYIMSPKGGRGGYTGPLFIRKN